MDKTVGFDEKGLRQTVSLIGSATLDFPSIAAAGTANLTIAVAGAAVGDPVAVGVPAAFNAGLSVHGFVSAADTVTVRVINATAGALNPASAAFAVCVFKT